MSRLIVSLFCLLAFASCKRASAPTASGESDKNFTHVEDTDAAMNNAIANAKKTSDTFIQALRNPKPSYRDFFVKKPYPAKGSKAEHMWIGALHEVGYHLEGRIANEPFETTEIKFGQTVSVKLDEISDWKYLDENRLIGGYTIRYFYDRMSQDEKKAFLHEAGFAIE